MTQASHPDLFETVSRCLAESDPELKIAATLRAADDWEAGRLNHDPAPASPVRDQPGRPARLELVAPRHLVARKLTSREGQAAMIHAVAHIEFNAINLALDAVQRFRDMPVEFHADWLRIAAEEAKHFGLMLERLHDLGHDYGDFPAHDGLWEMARRTAGDPLIRMALVPRVLEARGLDVTPGMIARFEGVEDRETGRRLGVILAEEVGHVAAGSHWFKRLCAERGLDPSRHYFELLEAYMTGEIRGPLNRAKRLEAGFDEAELDRLEALCQRASDQR